ncbi:MAG: hypothetical protein J5517_06125 [Eubacterium sp.]|nr:hypothetical protein [Eubacterium sp.]
MSGLGIALVVGFIVILVLCIIADKNSNKKFKARFEKENTIVDSYGDYYITDKGELIHYLPSGSLVGYKVWNLSEISYVAITTSKMKMSNVRVSSDQLSILDENQKPMKGKYLTPSKKPLKEYGYVQFDIRVGQSFDDVINLIKKHADHVQVMKYGKIVQ